jgi:hypothetical protein
MYLIIKNKNNKHINTNLMGYFKLFINKYIDNEITHFTIYINKMNIVYSNFVIINEENKCEKLINEFENKYNNFTIEVVETITL